jgi:hypothetical protein
MGGRDALHEQRLRRLGQRDIDLHLGQRPLVARQTVDDQRLGGLGRGRHGHDRIRHGGAGGHPLDDQRVGSLGQGCHDRFVRGAAGRLGRTKFDRDGLSDRLGRSGVTGRLG